MLKTFITLGILIVIINSASIQVGIDNDGENEKKNPEEGDLFEGDIAGFDVEKGAAQIPTATRIKWEYGIVPYVIDQVYNQSDIDMIMLGMKLVEEGTRINGNDCIKFVPRTTEATYIKVNSNSGCSSYIGKQLKEGEQVISLERPNCLVRGTIAHEFIHALGFFHEQSRPDRDEHIQVLYENITPGKENNFNKYNFSQIDLLNLPYDHESVMHYSSSGFSKNGLPTIASLKEGVVMGQRKQLSPIDIAEIRAFYNCS